MRVLVTGAHGFIGRHVLPRLIEKGWEVYAIIRSVSQNHRPDVQWIEADLLKTDAKEVVQKIRAEMLLHLAWVTEHGRFWHAPENIHWVQASTALLEAFCEGGGTKAVIAGTCAEYDWSYGYCREDQTPCNPFSFYGKCKYALYLMAQGLCAANGVALCWARVFFPYGPGEARDRLIPSMIRNVLQGRQAICRNSHLYRDFIHVQDAADALVALLDSPASKGVYNISSGRPVGLREIARLIGEACGRPDLIRYEESDGREQPMLVGDNAKLRSLGWKERISLEKGIRLYVQALKKEMRNERVS